MEHQQKIIEVLASAINHLEDSMQAIVNRDENGMNNSVWQAAADLEYANFLFSIIQGEAKSLSGKLDLHSKQVETGPLLASAQDLLKEAKSRLDVGEFYEAHKKTWVARGYLLKVQEILEKRQKKRGKSTPAP